MTKQEKLNIESSANEIEASIEKMKLLVDLMIEELECEVDYVGGIAKEIIDRTQKQLFLFANMVEDYLHNSQKDLDRIQEVLCDAEELENRKNK